MVQQNGLKHAIETNNLADALERVLDKGMVIAGDIKIKLVDIELLTIQLRLVICSVDKTKEIGMDWWTQGSAFLELVNSASATTRTRATDRSAQGPVSRKVRLGVSR